MEVEIIFGAARNVMTVECLRKILPGARGSEENEEREKEDPKVDVQVAFYG
jgi:hypothetical protein